MKYINTIHFFSCNYFLSGKKYLAPVEYF